MHHGQTPERLHQISAFRGCESGCCRLRYIASRSLEQSAVGAPKCLPDCLQSVLNAAARLLCNRRKYDHVTPLLRDVLRWLPVPLRIEFKICLLVYKSLLGAAPGYLRDYCKETHPSASGLRLRSTDKCDLLNNCKTDEDSVW